MFSFQVVRVATLMRYSERKPPHLSFRTQRSGVRNLKSTFTTKDIHREGTASWIPPYGRNDGVGKFGFEAT